MEAMRWTGIAQEGKLSLTLPKEFEDRELEVIVLPLSDSKSTPSVSVNANDDRNKRLLSIIGSARFPNYPVSEYDVYEQ